MSSRYVLSPETASDLDAILDDYLAQGGPDVARKIAGDFRRALRRLASHPRIGHSRRDLTSLPVRFWPVYSYRIIYDPVSRPVRIVRVLHSAQDILRTLGQ